MEDSRVPCLLCWRFSRPHHPCPSLPRGQGRKPCAALRVWPSLGPCFSPASAPETAHVVVPCGQSWLRARVRRRRAGRGRTRPAAPTPGMGTARVNKAAATGCLGQGHSTAWLPSVWLCYPESGGDPQPTEAQPALSIPGSPTDLPPTCFPHFSLLPRARFKQMSPWARRQGPPVPARLHEKSYSQLVALRRPPLA